MTASFAAAPIEGDLIARREGACGVIRLNRPKAINAVTLEMLRDIDKALDAFASDPAVAVILLEGAGERGLCAGGDIRALWESSKVQGDLGKILWREEYILNARIAKLPKPYVAFMDGIVMGGGVGLSAHASHRIVTEKTKLAMPEVSLGFFPDVGGTWLLAHSPGEIGSYFGLTGTTMNGPDAIHACFADAVLVQETGVNTKSLLSVRCGEKPVHFWSTSRLLINVIHNCVSIFDVQPNCCVSRRNFANLCAVVKCGGLFATGD